MPGIYYVHLKVKKPVKIVCISVEDVIIKSDFMPVFSVLQSDCEFKNITIMGDARTEKDKTNLIEVVNSRVILKDMSISNSSLAAVYGYGKKTDIFIQNCKISECSQSGIVIIHDAKCSIDKSNIISNHESQIQILETDYSNLFIINSQISDGIGCGVKLLNESNMSMENSELSNNRRRN